MGNHSTSDTPKQLGFADLDNQDPRPLPIIVAEKWNFPLQYHIIDSVCYFSVIDWIAGIGTSDNVSATKIWTKMQNQVSISSRQLEYKAQNKRVYQMAFADDKGLYDIAQNMRVMKDRPALKSIQDYLSQSGATMDDWRLHPDKMLSIAQARMLSDIERHEKAGLGNRPEIELLRSKMDATKTLKELKHSVTRLLEMSGQEWAKFHNEELWQLLGYTAKQIQKARNPKKSARNNLNIFETNSMKYAESQLIALLSMQKTIDPERLRNSVQFIFKPIGENLRGMLESIGIDILTGQHELPSGK